MNTLFTGVGTAMITPFNKNGDVNWESLEYLIEQQISAGIDFLVPCGTTGESPTLGFKEHCEVIKFVVDKVDGRVPVLAGTGSNSTREAVDLTEFAKGCGADGALVVSPYYNRPEQAGILDYYRQVGKVGLPVILYDIGSRTGRDVSTSTIITLANESAIAGVKWASGNQNQLMELLKETMIPILSGDDIATYGAMALKASGVISVLSNLLPKQMVNCVNHLSEGNFSSALLLNNYYLELMNVMFTESNPQPIKTAMSIVDTKYGDAVFRSPLVNMEEENVVRLKKVLTEYNLL